MQVLPLPFGPLNGRKRWEEDVAVRIDLNPQAIDRLRARIPQWLARTGESCSTSECEGVPRASGDMKRRVMIAKALAHEPDILFLDEPTAGVDVWIRLGMTGAFLAVCLGAVAWIFRTGYRLKN